MFAMAYSFAVVAIEKRRYRMFQLATFCKLLSYFRYFSSKKIFFQNCFNHMHIKSNQLRSNRNIAKVSRCF